AKAIDEDKILHARRKGKNKLVIFDDVDIMTMVEREFGTKKAPIGHIIRGANKKSYREIHEEIRKAQVDTLGADYQSNQQLKYKRLPWFMKKALWRKHSKNPYFKKKFTGTCSLTAVGMFGKGNAWGLTPSGDTVMMVLGGIDKKPAVINDKIEIREFLSVTLGFDHDIIDGAPAARFGIRLKNLIENADDLK
ncbi:MAG: 2-oxo acid dehydrogenase subunit E2, partial [Promethearchaeota archaeon]